MAKSPSRQRPEAHNELPSMPPPLSPMASSASGISRNASGRILRIRRVPAGQSADQQHTKHGLAPKGDACQRGFVRADPGRIAEPSLERVAPLLAPVSSAVAEELDTPCVAHVTTVSAASPEATPCVDRKPESPTHKDSTNSQQDTEQTVQDERGARRSGNKDKEEEGGGEEGSARELVGQETSLKIRCKDTRGDALQQEATKGDDKKTGSHTEPTKAKHDTKRKKQEDKRTKHSGEEEKHEEGQHARSLIAKRRRLLKKISQCLICYTVDPVAFRTPCHHGPWCIECMNKYTELNISQGWNACFG